MQQIYALLLPDLLPENSECIQNTYNELKEDKASAENEELALEMTTDRGKEGALYQHGENLILEIKATICTSTTSLWMAASSEFSPMVSKTTTK